MHPLKTGPSAVTGKLAAWALCCLATVATTAHGSDVSDITQLYRAGQTAEAFTKLDAMIGARGERPDLRFLKGVLQVESRRPDEALVVFQQLTEEFPELPEPYNNLAALYAARGDFEKARAALEGALRANPSFATAHQNLGDVYAQLAKQAYQRALQFEPTNREIQPKLLSLRELTDLPARRTVR
jgi:Flp pilus assembly protein TadD